MYDKIDTDPALFTAAVDEYLALLQGLIVEGGESIPFIGLSNTRYSQASIIRKALPFQVYFFSSFFGGRGGLLLLERRSNKGSYN